MFQEDQVKVQDFQRALHIAEYSAAISNILIANTAGDQPNPPTTPDNLTQFVSVKHALHTSRSGDAEGFPPWNPTTGGNDDGMGPQGQSGEIIV